MKAAAPAQATEEKPKQKRDPVRTKARILNSATQEFSRHGLGGARVERITKRAGANKRMLYYYFGGKELLFVAVLEKAYEDFGNAQRELHLDEFTPVEAMRRLMAFLWDYFLDNPEFIRLLNSENLHQAKHLKRSTRVHELASHILAILGGVVRRGQAEGVFRPDVDINQLYITVTGLGYFYLSNRYTLSTLLAMDMLAPDARSARLAHITEVVVAYLTADRA
ncbi:HTH-type transcriptional repressor NicS [Burkholderiales bacterium]|nr:MAG: TetR/AcrR family transcriptional regulator [Burkholderiales bacterium]CAG0994736.1 HTH-type transcriptional repressor NicS [Burkholderiales bacterium]